MAPIPFACYGTDVELADKIGACMQPEYELVHGCFSLAAATTELPDSFAGNLDKADAASEPIGSNARAPRDQRRAPRFLCIGGTIPDEH
ncbi:hypothetical protein GGTG_06691 [Gaeumannomyces tritici R3-111a-1]|uniref:Uncharacterized protein n=1 Tax=Gaeumannomyces tritici (strain R3-111a-1) TaxID=644352 RepID=J3NZJ3_GAET3|nr:hypothetical protein GGTG_06691 [Gaeumannomyces tritici R3-111a-1]EJT76776.1 hypothetical protein GGTG_06691 [Gaeumannomyces tritici R3-111a-1]